MRWSFDAYEVVLADDRDSAIAALRRVEPAVVTLDLGLPPHPDTPDEGFRLLGEILTLAPATKVIALTGQDERANAVRAIAMGAYDFFEKPFDAETLGLTRFVGLNFGQMKGQLGTKLVKIFEDGRIALPAEREHEDIAFDVAALQKAKASDPGNARRLIQDRVR
jgi:CheY-like chemotaxis protein